MTRLRLLSLLLFMLLPAVAGAQATRAALIQRIADAQGLGKMFDEQLVQQRAAAQAYGQQVFDKAVFDSGVNAGPTAKDALARYMARASALFASGEYMAVWSKAYADTALTDDDLKTILAYYESPVGKRDGAASQQAMKGFTSWLIEQNQARMSAQLDRLTADLREALP